jgi:hypothetical protein
VFANWFNTTYTKHFIINIYHLRQPECEASQIDVKDVLDNCLLLSRSDLMSVVASIRAMRDSVVLASQCCMRYVESLSSTPEAWKMLCIIGIESELDSAFSIRWLCVLMLRNVALMSDWRVLAETVSLDVVVLLDGGIRYTVLIVHIHVKQPCPTERPLSSALVYALSSRKVD